MIKKTEAIVLNTRKFGDTSLITSMYTRNFGRQSYLIKGYRSTRAKKRHSYFQPMSIIEVVLYYKENRDLQLVTESSNRYYYKTMQTDPIRITLGMVVMEVFYQSVREEERNPTLFDFLQRVLVTMDQQSKHLINTFLYFLLHLTRHLGFYPDIQVTDMAKPIYFDVRGGTLKNAIGLRSSDMMIAKLSESSLDNCTDLRFSNADKKEMISTLLQYYLLHVEGFREPESLIVFREIFASDKPE